MTVGSLFSGIGGLELGLEMCGVGPVLWQCDSDPCARAVLAEHWPDVRRYDDVREVDGNAAHVDVVCGGFPCQPASVAGRRRGQADARWLWPAFAAVVAAIRPRFVFIENVPGLRTLGLRDVLGDLTGLGFDAEWGCFTAAEVGAPHRRRRLFVLAYADSEGRGPAARNAIGSLRAEADGVRSFKPGRRIGDDRTAWKWPPEPDVGRVAHGVPARAHRLRLLGNAVVPAQAALAWRTLTARTPEVTP